MIQEQNKKTKRKKADKEPEIFLPKPSVLDTLPIQVPKLIFFIITCLPQAATFIKTSLTDQIKEVTKPAPPPEEPQEPPPKIKTVRKRNKGFTLPEGPNFQTTQNYSETKTESAPPLISSGGLWTDDDLAELVRLVKKYPGGTTGRWEIIGEMMGRTVPEVTYMAHKMKENCYKLPEEEPVVVKVKQKTKKEIDSEDNLKKWSQNQQRAFEDALARFPKGCAERWDKIAECVPNKNKV